MSRREDGLLLIPAGRLLGDALGQRRMLLLFDRFAVASLRQPRHDVVDLRDGPVEIFEGTVGFADDSADRLRLTYHAAV